MAKIYYKNINKKKIPSDEGFVLPFFVKKMEETGGNYWKFSQEEIMMIAGHIQESKEYGK